MKSQYKKGNYKKSQDLEMKNIVFEYFTKLSLLGNAKEKTSETKENSIETI